MCTIIYHLIFSFFFFFFTFCCKSSGLLPDGYAIHRADRTDGRRGGGVALIYKQCLDIKCNKSQISTT